MKVRFAGNIARFYGINATEILNNDLQRQLETKIPLQIDEIELRNPAMKP